MFIRLTAWISILVIFLSGVLSHTYVEFHQLDHAIKVDINLLFDDLNRRNVTRAIFQFNLHLIFCLIRGKTWKLRKWHWHGIYLIKYVVEWDTIIKIVTSAYKHQWESHSMTNILIPYVYGMRSSNWDRSIVADSMIFKTQCRCQNIAFHLK